MNSDVVITQSIYSISRFSEFVISWFCNILYFMLAFPVAVMIVYLIAFVDDEILTRMMAAVIVIVVFGMFERIFWFVLISRYPVCISHSNGEYIFRYGNKRQKRFSEKHIQIIENRERLIVKGSNFIPLYLIK